MQTSKTDRSATMVGTTGTRELSIDNREIDLETRTVGVAFSSEAPVERWWGTEILSHEPGAMRLERINDSAAVLLDHRPGQQIGVIESARSDKDKIGRADIRFSRGPLGDEIFEDVRDEIRTKVSVKYVIRELNLDSSSDDGGDVYRVTDWEPIEVSIVSIPADISVGVGRSANSPQRRNKPMPEFPAPNANPDNEPDTRNNQTQAAAGNDPVPTPTPTPEPAAPVINPEAAAIRAVAAHFKMADEGENQIMLGRSLEEFRTFIRTQRQDPVPAAPRIETRIPRAGNLRAFVPGLYHGGRQEAEEAAYRAGQWCKAVLFGDQDAQRWCRDHDVLIAIQKPGSTSVQRVLTGIGAGQSVVVPDELILPIISLREEYGLARQKCHIHPMSSDTASVPRDAADSEAYFVGREEAPTPSDPTLDNVELTAKNLAAESRLANDYADDSAINLADHVADKHARAFAVKEDRCLFNGDGTSTYGGIVGLRVGILGLAGAVDAASGNDTFAEITAADLRGVMAALPDFPGMVPEWYTSKPGQNLMFGRLTDAVGGNTKRHMAEMMPDQWGGYDISTSPAMPKVATDLSDVAMAVFGDLRMGVVLGDRRGMTLMVDPYSLSSYQQTKIISSERFDLNCHGVGSATEAGPVVALIGE